MPPLLQVQDLSKTFYDGIGVFGTKEFRAVENVSFLLEQGQSLAIIGNNGSGKSTVAKMLVGLMEPTSGKIFFKGKLLSYTDPMRGKYIRMVYQDPKTAFNPRLNVGQILDAPLRVATELDEDERNYKIASTLRLVGLLPEHVNIRISAMSMSQRQRIALARALILDPQVIIADDSLSFLDPSVRSQLANLMQDLQRKLGISYIYIGQHIGVIKHFADEVLVLHEGQMIEYGTTKTLFTRPHTDVTRRLVESYFGRILDENAWQESA